MIQLNKISYVGIFLLFVLLLAGCSNSEGNTTPKQEQEGTTPEATVKVQEAEGQQTRKVMDAKGEVTIPANPQRIADISGSTEELLILGFKPILSGNTDMADPTLLTPIVKEKLGKSTSTAGWFQTEINLEALVAASPDLILAGPTQEKVYEQLEKIAPTIRVPFGFNAFRDRFAFVAEVMDKTTEMKSWLKSYEERAADLHSQIEAVTGQETFAVIEATQKEIRIYSRTGVAAILFNDLSLPMAPGTPEPDPWGGKVTSLEALASFDADHILLLAENDQNVLEQNDIWSNLRAVRSGHVYRMTTRQNYNEAFFALGKLAVMEQISGDILQKKN
ncbi:ABC transporter substrate-binding protein [Paenibacillus eucommiae]|uniref:Iron complex transport system substrate-binding protein n=1 Tax=Paenibacillus eucommiae TaxID=1355755 RepID=A0ABS4IM38_9BACL|nr:ABC transporter substrate-binding protein [Paenibacillus eucommiae]MBP1988580.1 iron complex transport system substrate-binding protein [Paenibacillus eucommiae]